MIRLLLFIVGALLFGAAALGVGYSVWGESALVQGGVAFALAFVPAAGTLAWVVWSYRHEPEMRLMAGLGGSGVRMMVALGGGYFLTNTYPETFGFEFYSWLTLFYLVLLFFEMAILVQQDNKMNQPAPTNLSNQGGDHG
jgi:hypothetical protein